MITQLLKMVRNVLRVLITLLLISEISSGVNNRVLKMSLLLFNLLETTLLVLLIFVLKELTKSSELVEFLLISSRRSLEIMY